MGVCKCDKLPRTFYLDEAPVGWAHDLAQETPGNWKTLRRCPACDRLFSIDVWDKYQDQVVLQIKDRASWEQEADSDDRRKELLLRSRGGADDGGCGWVGCQSARVRGVAYCLDHLWKSGARR